MGVMSALGSFFGGDDAAEASAQASQTQAQYYQDALNYLMQQQAVPSAVSQDAMMFLAGLYGMEGVGDIAAGESVPYTGGAMGYDVPGAGVAGRPMEHDPSRISQTSKMGQTSPYGPDYDYMGRLQASPLYQAIMGSREAGEQSIMRQAGASGGLRSGNVQGALSQYNSGLEQQALMSALSGITGMTGYAPDPSQAAGMMGGIGETLGAGQVAAAQAQQAAQQQGIGTLLGIGDILAEAGVFSDRRLKSNIEKIGYENGLNVYSWNWNEKANKLGLTGSDKGYLADEVFEKYPEAVIVRDGILKVLYNEVFNG